jgi:ABC-type transporter Mla subunit MlaD
MRRILATLALATACGAAAFIATAADDGGDAGTEYKIVFDNAFGLVEGGDFRVGGVTAGQTIEFDVQKRRGQAPKALVMARVDRPGFDDFRADASCEVRPQSLIGEYYVDCQPGKSERKLPRNTVPVEQTSSTIPTDLVQNVMRLPVRERLRLIVAELGTGLAGRPQDLQAVLRRAHPGLRETGRVLKILGDQNRIIERFLRDADTVVAQLERNKRDVLRFVREAGDTAEVSAARRADLERSFERLPRFLAELRPTMTELGALADAQIPTLARLQRAAPALDELFRRLGPFSDAARPAVRSLGDASVEGVRAVRDGRDEVRELVRVGEQAPATFLPLREYLQSIDDRSRTVELAGGRIENDPRARVGAPPPPDITAPSRTPRTTGFTGMESFWNYFFWQGLSLNGFDDVGHLLRVNVQLNPACGGTPGTSSLKVNRQQVDAAPEECKQWLGPNQPGVTTPDPTAGGGASAVRRDAAPLPGGRDISKPQVTLPPGLQGLLDGPTGMHSSAPRLAPRGRSEALLDYLLGP